MLRRRQLTADEIIGTYVEWREHAQAVWEAYDAWNRSRGAERDVAFCVYRVVLSKEQRASERYAEAVGCVHSPAPVIAEHVRSRSVDAHP